MSGRKRKTDPDEDYYGNQGQQKERKSQSRREQRLEDTKISEPSRLVPEFVLSLAPGQKKVVQNAYSILGPKSLEHANNILFGELTRIGWAGQRMTDADLSLLLGMWSENAIDWD